MEKLAAQNFFAQGDVFFLRVDEIPADAVKQPAAKSYIVAHSETQHHHTCESPCAEYFTSPKDPFTCYLQIAGDAGAEIVHHRMFDTHKTVSLTQGTYMIRRQKEYSPEGWKMVSD